MKKTIALLLIIEAFISIWSINIQNLVKKNYGNYLFYVMGENSSIGIYLKNNIVAFSNTFDENDTVYNFNGKEIYGKDFYFLGSHKGLFFYKSSLNIKKNINYKKNINNNINNKLYIFVFLNGEFKILTGNLKLSDINKLINAKYSAFVFDKKGKIIGILSKKKLNDLIRIIFFKFSYEQSPEIDITNYLIGTFVTINDLMSDLKDINLLKEKAWLGINYSIYKDYVKIIKVIPNSPAEKSGLKNNDIIIKIDGKEGNVNSLINTINSKKPGDSVKLVIKRNKKLMVLNVVLGRKKELKKIMNKKVKVGKQKIEKALEKIELQLEELKKQLKEK